MLNTVGKLEPRRCGCPHSCRFHTNRGYRAKQGGSHRRSSWAGGTTTEAGLLLGGAAGEGSAAPLVACSDRCWCRRHSDCRRGSCIVCGAIMMRESIELLHAPAFPVLYQIHSPATQKAGWQCPLTCAAQTPPLTAAVPSSSAAGRWVPKALALCSRLRQ